MVAKKIRKCVHILILGTHCDHPHIKEDRLILENALGLYLRD